MIGRNRVTLPPTRNHRQLAAWVNAQGLVDEKGCAVVATVIPFRTNTDGRVAGTRFRRPGKGRAGLLLEILLKGEGWHADARIFRHESGETYRRHDEARKWIEQNLRHGSKGKR